MNSLEQIPEEKENVCLTKVPSGISKSKLSLTSSNKSLASNYSSQNTKKPLGVACMSKVLSPSNINYISKINTKLKSSTTSIKSIRSMPPVAAPEPESIEELEDQLEALILHQKTCQSESKYVEAEMAKQRVKELKELLEKRTKGDLKQRHSKEMTEIQKAYLDEMDQFNSFWDKKIAEFDEDSTRIENELMQKQDMEMNNFIDDLDKSLDVRPKDNTEILNLRKVEAELAKIEDYMQAYAIKQKIAVIEKEEMEKYAFERQKRMKNLVAQLKNKHTTELQALQKRIQAGKEEQVKLRSIEFERLMQKFMIAKKDLQQSQINEVNQYSKSVKMGSLKDQIYDKIK